VKTASVNSTPILRRRRLSRVVGERGSAGWPNGTTRACFLATDEPGGMPDRTGGIDPSTDALLCRILSRPGVPVWVPAPGGELCWPDAYRGCGWAADGADTGGRRGRWACVPRATSRRDAINPFI